ncbi:O-antigen translocase [Simiduia litorea]
MLALYVGPSGYAALGQFQNVIQVVTTFSTGAITTGVTKYTAEHHQDEALQHAVWRTAGTITLILTFMSAIFLVGFKDVLAVWLLNDQALSGVFIWFSMSLIFSVLNALLCAILNGKKEIKLYVVANIAGSIFALVSVIALSVQWGLYGALVALAVYQSLSFFVTFFLVTRTNWFRLSYIFGGIDSKISRDLAKFAAMALASAVCVPVSHILIRNHLGESLGWDYAGYWEAMWRLSSAYLMFITMTLSVYYLPRLSELSDRKDLQREILDGYKIILPAAVFCSSIVYLSRSFLIDLLFSPEFSEMGHLFFWQMVGDTLKIASWILAYVLIAKAYWKVYVFAEVIISSLFYFLVYFFVDVLGVEATAIAHAVCYLLYFIFLGVALRLKNTI